MLPKISSQLDAYSEPGRTAAPWLRSMMLLVVMCTSVLGLLGMLPTTSTLASGSSTESETVISLQVTAEDHSAGGSTLSRGIHTSGVASPEGGRHAPMTFKSEVAGPLVIAGPGRVPAQSPGTIGVVYPSAAGFPAGGFYPYDVNLYDPNTGVIKTLAQSHVVTYAQFHNIYVNQKPDHWGNPSIFQKHLFESDFILLVDQYVDSDEDERYKQGTAALVNYPIPSTPLSDGSDISAIVHAAAVKFGTGYSHVYNVFLPKGVDVCITTTFCFSPDNVATWAFCGYHGDFNFTDVGEVLYTVEPYLDVFGIFNGVAQYPCDVGQPSVTVNTAPTPNGVLVDSMSALVSHEIFETVTDPGPRFTGWYSFNTISGDEIGDICVNPYFQYVPFKVSEKLYYIQPEYSNKYHACMTVP